MFEIKSFTLHPDNLTLTITTADQDAKNKNNTLLSYELIRVYSPVDNKDKQHTSPVCHKKQVKLMAIEFVGKHGYRFIFDDQHSAIYGANELSDLCHNHEEMWQQYLNALKSSGHSREAMIDFKQL